VLKAFLLSLDVPKPDSDFWNKIPYEHIANILEKIDSFTAQFLLDSYKGTTSYETKITIVFKAYAICDKLVRIKADSGLEKYNPPHFDFFPHSLTAPLFLRFYSQTSRLQFSQIWSYFQSTNQHKDSLSLFNFENDSQQMPDCFEISFETIKTTGELSFIAHRLQS